MIRKVKVTDDINYKFLEMPKFDDYDEGIGGDLNVQKTNNIDNPQWTYKNFSDCL
jgi:hypothetical protein